MLDLKLEVFANDCFRRVTMQSRLHKADTGLYIFKLHFFIPKIKMLFFGFLLLLCTREAILTFWRKTTIFFFGVVVVLYPHCLISEPGFSLKGRKLSDGWFWISGCSTHTETVTFDDEFHSTFVIIVGIVKALQLYISHSTIRRKELLSWAGVAVIFFFFFYCSEIRTPDRNRKFFDPDWDLLSLINDSQVVPPFKLRPAHPQVSLKEVTLQYLRAKFT